MQNNPMLTGFRERQRREGTAPIDHSDAADMQRHMGTAQAVDAFDVMVRKVCPVGGNPDEYGIRLGNVEFWIDAEGPWAGKLSFSIPTSQWDTKRITDDLVRALALAGVPK